LFPAFAHCFIDLVKRGYVEEARVFYTLYHADHMRLYGDDLAALSALSDPEHVLTDETAQKFLQNKISVKMTEYSFELLVKFLHTQNLISMLSVLNAHMCIEVVKGEPSAFEDDRDGAAVLSGRTPEAQRKFNSIKGRWGLVESCLEIERVKQYKKDTKEKEKAAAAKAREEAKKSKKKKGGANKDGEKDANEAAAGEEVADEEMAEAEEEKKEAEYPVAMLENPPNTIKGRVPIPTLDYDAHTEMVEDLRWRIKLSKDSLPSVCFFTFQHAHGLLTCADATGDVKHVAGGFADSIVRVWHLDQNDDDDAQPVDPANPEAKRARSIPMTEFVGHSEAVQQVVFSPCGRFLLSASRDCQVRVWSMELKICLCAYEGHFHPIWDVQWCPFGYYFATASHDRIVRVYAMDQAMPRRMMVGHLSNVDCVAWHPNANYIATGSADRTVRLWDVSDGECTRVFVGHAAGVRSLVFSPDGRNLASGADDGRIFIWNLARANCAAVLKGHVGPVYSLDYAGGGGLLTSGGDDDTVRVWDAEVDVDDASADADDKASRRLPLETFATKNTPVYKVKFSRRNLCLALGARRSRK
jgi:transcription initiation factor TFIID subunit 5